jgi:nucleoside-diphosphate-sugar epimerase
VTYGLQGKKVVVTGVAGFIGSALAEHLVRSGAEVHGVDCFTPYYDAEVKVCNLETLRDAEGFDLVQADLRECDLQSILDGAHIIFHLAGQPGVRLSWADGFGEYVSHNVLATQRLLEAARELRVRRLVFASSSSVYGNAAVYPTTEQSLPRPFSPYGVTKLAAEHLCRLYSDNWGLPTVSLRYFSVYGPRQRPDMAVHRLIEAALQGRPFEMYGDGDQIRDFTYVDDVVAATISAGTEDAPAGTVMNVAGGSATTMTDLIQQVGSACDRKIEVHLSPVQAGDVDRTAGSIDLARGLLGWRPLTDLTTGLAHQVEWHERHAVTSHSSVRGGKCARTG